eukprot:jgi/Chlat1/5407/Chrsp35S00400
MQAGLPGGATYAPPGVVTTEVIQKYLDENQQLIIAILDNQNLGKLSECAQVMLNAPHLTIVWGHVPVMQNMPHIAWQSFVFHKRPGQPADYESCLH